MTCRRSNHGSVWQPRWWSFTQSFTASMRAIWKRPAPHPSSPGCGRKRFSDGLSRSSRRSFVSMPNEPSRPGSSYQRTPYGTTYGFFDGHGWNMAFDHTTNRLNGVYDFADSGFGPLHQEFIYTNLIARDLTARIVAEYE